MEPAEVTIEVLERPGLPSPIALPLASAPAPALVPVAAGILGGLVGGVAVSVIMTGLALLSARKFVVWRCRRPIGALATFAP